jgi:hypothetical protein
MKRISILAFALVTIFAGSGCLKDKGFENEEYGGPQIKSGPGSDAVSFPEASRSPLAQSLEAIATAQVITTKVYLESNQPATQNIVVTITPNAALVPAGVTPIPAANYSVPATVTIPAGAWSADVPITITGANTFNPANQYGVAISITSVNPSSYTIANNLKTLVYTFAIKNKYDGLYRLKGVHTRAPYTFPYNVPDMELRTKTANSVEFWWRSVGDVGHPIGVGPGSVSWYGNTVAPVIVFNTTTDAVTNVFNQMLSAGGPPIDMYTGPGSGPAEFVTSGPRAIGGAKTIYVYWRYNANDLRGFLDTLIYIGPR